MFDMYRTQTTVVVLVTDVWQCQKHYNLEAYRAECQQTIRANITEYM